MKKIIQISLLVLLTAGVIIMLIAANKMVGNQEMNKPIIHLKAQDEIPLITEGELLHKLYSQNLFYDSIQKSALDLAAVEQYLEQSNEILTAKVYAKLGANWHIDVTTRRPVARIILHHRKDFYIDNNYRLMKLSPYFRPKILPFTGLEQLFPPGLTYEEIINNDSLKTKLKLDQIYRISQYVCKDAFFNAQIVQVQYAKKEGFILIPRVGKQIIIFGKAKSETMVERKFKKLATFYDKAIPYEGWSQYKSINLKFKNQIVAKKK